MHPRTSALGVALMCCILASVTVVGRAWSQAGTVLSHSKINSDDLDAVGLPLDDADEFGDAVASLGDLDGAGPSVTALAVGAVGDDDGGSHYGAVYILFLNVAGDVLSYQKISSTQGNFTGQLGLDDEFGGSITSLGDLDGAGPSVRAIAVGAIGDDDGGVDAGAVYILFLNSAGTVLSHQKISDTQGGLTGGPLDQLDEFGGAVAGLGDLDGAGPSAGALAVGCIGDDDGGPQRGSTYILFLNSNGTVLSRQKISDLVGGFTAILDDNDNFGEDLAFMGDLDGPGPSVATLVASAVDDDDGGRDRGAVYVMFLSSTGSVLSHQKISSTVGNFTGVLAESDNFGASVIGLGDLDGTGPSIAGLAVGAGSDDGAGLNRGAVYILLLNAGGVVISHVEVSSNSGNFVGQLDDLDEFGSAVCALGDIDGNGAGAQFLVSAASMDDDGGPDRGAVYILKLAGVGSVGVDDAPSAARLDGLSFASPNPFKSSTTIPYRINEVGHVRIDILDARGRLVRELVRGTATPGEHRVVWNGLDNAGRPMAPGSYFLKMSVNGQPLSAGTKAVLLR